MIFINYIYIYRLLSHDLTIIITIIPIKQGDLIIYNQDHKTYKI